MSRAMADRVAVAVLAKAPVSGLAKTRLIPALGADGAAALQAQLIERAVATAQAASLGRVTLWCAPDDSHALFAAMREKFGVALARQPDGDLGARMHAAFLATNKPTLVIGTDCPAMTAAHLCEAAEALRSHDAVLIPAEDGGYVLIGLRRPYAELFAAMEWSVPTVMDETRKRLRSRGLTWCEPITLWDVDRPADLEKSHTWN
jgi:rSAM/selenodomain-associated transferase 1